MSTIAEYITTHPWLTFKDQFKHYPLGMRLGEAFSKCSHLAGTPLQPAIAADLSSFYLAKGAAATTAIEGNTLSESEVKQILDGDKKLPPSQEYLEREVTNVASVLRGIDESSQAGTRWYLTPEWLKEQNRLILEGIDDEDYVVPGEFTTKQLTVGQGVYRPVEPREVPMLVDKLCDWTNETMRRAYDTTIPADERFVLVFHAAVLAHLYIAWIHPFGNGNGRTARALECAVLAHSGLVPWVATNLLSDFYNRTRTKYYQVLANASRKRDVDGFISYSAEGFVDMLREQIRTVQTMQRSVAWVNYVHERFHHQTQGDTSRRRRALALALPEGKPTPRSALRRLTPELAEMYTRVGDRALSHDTNRLVKMGLIRGDARGGFTSNISIMDAFMPAPSPRPLV
ncbi:MAG: Fic family protein [Mycolicibacterium frederiksbergense]|nr:Fic family protein [Mycolicibacterium frederiksbergense]